MKLTKFYAYIWFRDVDGTFPAGTPYYVGKGQRRRGWTTVEHRVRRPRNGAHIVLIPCDTEEEAYAEEMRLIALYGRAFNGTGCLRNITEGGGGHLDRRPARPKRVMSPEHRAKLCKPRTTLICLHCSKPFETVPSGQGQKFCSKICAFKHPRRAPRTCLRCGKTYSPSSRKQKLCSWSCRNDNLRKPVSETLKKIEAAKRRVKSPEHRKKISDALKGRTHSPETLQKIIDAQRRRAATPKGREHILRMNQLRHKKPVTLP